MAGARAERSSGRAVHGLSHGYGAAAFRRLRRSLRCAWPDADRRIIPDYDGPLQDLYMRFRPRAERRAPGTRNARRIGNRHAEMFANHSLGFCLTAAGRYAEAADVQPKALAQARTLKARRYEAVILAHCAEVALSMAERPKLWRSRARVGKFRTRLAPGSPLRYFMVCSHCLRIGARIRKSLSRRGGVARARLGWAQPLLVPTLRDRTGIAFRGLGGGRHRPTPCCFEWLTNRSPTHRWWQSVVTSWLVADEAMRPKATRKG